MSKLFVSESWLFTVGDTIHKLYIFSNEVQIEPSRPPSQITPLGFEFTDMHGPVLDLTCPICHSACALWLTSSVGVDVRQFKL